MLLSHKKSSFMMMVEAAAVAAAGSKTTKECFTTPPLPTKGPAALRAKKKQTAAQTACVDLCEVISCYPTIY